VDSQSVIHGEDYFTNFSNPHLKRPSWAHNMRSKVAIRSYKRGEAPINDILFPDRQDSKQIDNFVAEQYQYNKPSIRSGSVVERLPEIINNVPQIESRHSSKRSSVMGSKRLATKNMIIQQQNLDENNSPNKTMLDENMSIQKSRHGVNRSFAIENTAPFKNALPPSGRAYDNPGVANLLNPQKQTYLKSNIDQMYFFSLFLKNKVNIWK